MTCALPQDVLRLLDRSELAFGTVRRGRIGGVRESEALGAGTDFHDYRHYVPGDDMRFLDWNALGRLGEAHVKRFRQDETGRLTLLIDRSASMAADAAAATARTIAAAVGYTGLATGYDVELAPVPGDDVRLEGSRWRGRGAAGPLFEQLDGLGFGSRVGLADALNRTAGSRDLGSVAVLVTDFAEPGGADRVLRIFRTRRCRVAVVQVLHPAVIPSLGYHEIIDPEVREDTRVRVRVTRRVQDAFRARLARYHEHVRLRCRAFDVRHAVVDAGTAADRALVVALKDGGVLR